MATQNTTQNTTQTTDLEVLLANPMVQALIAQTTSQAVAAVINATKKPTRVRKGNTRATVKAGAEELLAKLTEQAIVPKTDVWLYTSSSGRNTLFCQFSKTESEELELMASMGFEPWSNKDSKKDMWQQGRIIRLYADVPEGTEANYEAFRR